MCESGQKYYYIKGDEIGIEMCMCVCVCTFYKERKRERKHLSCSLGFLTVLTPARWWEDDNLCVRNGLIARAPIEHCQQHHSVSLSPCDVSNFLKKEWERLFGILILASDYNKADNFLSVGYGRAFQILSVLYTCAFCFQYWKRIKYRYIYIIQHF